MAQYLSERRIEGSIWLEASDILLLRNRIAEAEYQAKNLEDQIKRALDDTHTTDLTRQKGAKLVEIASLRNILSPIRRIPLEVLSEILELSCLPSSGIFTANHDIIQYTSTVSRVCVAWRRAAFATPRLWSKICVSFTGKDKNILLEDIIWIKEWLARSRGLPLELYLDIQLYQSRLIQPLVCILEFRGQIRLIDLITSRPHVFLPLFNLPCASFPLLEKLALRIVSRPTAKGLWDGLPRRIETFLGSPRLQSLSVGEPMDIPMLTRLALPLEQLTSLAIRLGSIVEFDHVAYRDTLHQCKHLISLKVDFSRFSDFGFDTDFSICLPALKFLDIPCRDVFPHKFSLLHGLITSVLEGLVLRWYDQDIYGLCRDVIGLQNRSLTALSELTLRLNRGYQLSVVSHDNADNLLSILAAFPTVKSFQFDPVVTNLQAMIHTKSNPALLPSLTNLDLSPPYLSSSSSLQIRMYSILLLIRSRWSDSLDSEISDDSRVARLQKVTLHGPFCNIVTWDEFNFPGLIVELEDN